MSDPLADRLNEILPRITSDDFLAGKGLGNEIAFFIFDYPPEEELRIRSTSGSCWTTAPGRSRACGSST